MLEKIRSLTKNKFFTYLIVVFVVLILMSWTLGDFVRNRFAAGTNVIAEVGDITITAGEIKNRINNMMIQMRLTELNPQQQFFLRNNALQQSITSALLTIDAKENNVVITDDNLAEFLKSKFTDSEGNFNKEAFDEFKKKYVPGSIEYDRVIDSLKQDILMFDYQSFFAKSNWTDSDISKKLHSMFEEDRRDLKIAYINYESVKDKLQPVSDEELLSIYENYKEFYKQPPQLDISLIIFDGNQAKEVEAMVDSVDANKNIFSKLESQNKLISVKMMFVGGKFYVGPDNQPLSDEVTDFIEEFANGNFNQIDAYSEVTNIDKGTDAGKFVFAKIANYNPSVYKDIAEVKDDLLKRTQLQDYGNKLVDKIAEDKTFEQSALAWKAEKGVTRADAMLRDLDKAFKLPWPKPWSDKEYYVYGQLQSPDTYQIVMLEKVYPGDIDAMNEDFKNYFENMYRNQQLEAIVGAYLQDLANKTAIAVYLQQ